MLITCSVNLSAGFKSEEAPPPAPEELEPLGMDPALEPPDPWEPLAWEEESRAKRFNSIHNQVSIHLYSRALLCELKMGKRKVVI